MNGLINEVVILILQRDIKIPSFTETLVTARDNSEHYTLCKKASNHHANLPLEMYSFTL